MILIIIKYRVQEIFPVLLKTLISCCLNKALLDILRGIWKTSLKKTVGLNQIVILYVNYRVCEFVYCLSLSHSFQSYCIIDSTQFIENQYILFHVLHTKRRLINTKFIHINYIYGPKTKETNSESKIRCNIWYLIHLIKETIEIF